MSKTTYQLTAEYMANRHGVEQAITNARWFAARAKRRGGDAAKRTADFWNYVVVCLERMGGTTA